MSRIFCDASGCGCASGSSPLCVSLHTGIKTDRRVFNVHVCVCVCLKRKVQAQMLHTIGGKKISYENVQRPSSPHTQSLSRQPCEYWHEFFFSLCRQHTQTHIAPGLIFGKQPPPSSSLSLSPVRADGCGIRAQQKREKIYTSLCVLHRVFGASDKRPGAVKNPVYHVSHLLNKNIAHALHINSLTLLA